MATVNVTTTAQTLTTNTPYAVVDLTFNYAGTTAQTGTVIYYGAHLTDETNTEDVLFPFTVSANTDIPASEEFSYTPSVVFTNTVTASGGKVYYTA